MYLGKKYRVVIIDHPVNVMDEKVCSSILSQSFKMKYDGYEVTYGNNILPMDKADFFGTHITFCEEHKDGSYTPIFAYKATPLDRCLNYKYEFPALSLMNSDGHPSCVQDVKDIIKSAGHPSLVSYDSSWAQNLDYRFSDNKFIKEELREIMTMVIVKHHEEFNIPHMITCGAVKVKTDQYFLKIGLKRLNENANFYQKSLNNEEAVIFYTKQFSPWAYQMAEKHKDLWNDKLLIDGLSTLKSARQAA